MDNYSKEMQMRIRKEDRAGDLYAGFCIGVILMILGLAVYGVYRLVMG